METCRTDDSAHHRVTANGSSMIKYSNNKPGEVKYKNEYSRRKKKNRLCID